MKKSFIILFLILSLFVSACFKKENKDNDNDNQNNVNEKANVNLNIADFTLENIDGKDYICFNVIANSNKDANIKFNLSYNFKINEDNDIINTYLIANVDANIKKGVNLLDYQVEIIENYYDKYLYLNITDFKIDNELIFDYHTSIEKSVVSIALDVLSKDANNEIAKRIDNTINVILVSSIDISIDYENKKVQALGSGYTVNGTFNNDYIIVEIIFSAKARLTNDFNQLNINNDNKPAKGNLYVEDNKYYYKEEITKTNADVLISSISLTFDYLKHNEEIKKEEYVTSMSNPEYNKITITITMKDGFDFSSNFMLTINEKLVEESNYKIENKVLTYIFDDPNWTGFY